MALGEGTIQIVVVVKMVAGAMKADVIVLEMEMEMRTAEAWTEMVATTIVAKSVCMQKAELAEKASARKREPLSLEVQRSMHIGQNYSPL